MPHLWNNQLVVRKEELIPNWWKTYNALKQELYRYKDRPYGIKRAQLGGNGRELLIDFNSLPKEIQEELGDPRIIKHPLEPYYKVDSKAVEYYTHQFVYPDGSCLTHEAQQRYIINASVLQAVLELEKARIIIRLNLGGTLKGIKMTLCTDVQSFQEVLRVKHKTQHSLPSHPRHFKNTLNEFIKSGYGSLIKDAKGKSKQNARKVDKESIKLLNDLFATQSYKPTATEVARQYNAFLKGEIEVVNNHTGELYASKGLNPLSISTIKLYLNQWESKIGTYSRRSGDRQQLMQTFKPYHSLLRPKFSGSLLSIDDRQPPFAYESGKRVWFYNGIDLASEAFTCWVYGKSKEGIILEFYRQLIRNYAQWGINLPDGLECESSLNSSYSESFLREGIMFDNVRIEANNARGKRIEAFYRPLRYQYEKKREGWLARPFAKDASNQAGSHPIKQVPYEDIVQGCLFDIEKWNNSEHSKVKGVSRWEYFLSNQHPNLKPTNYKAILPHLGYKTESSCRAGIIKLQYREFLLGDQGEIATGDSLIKLMKQVEGKTLDIYWLDNNEGGVLKALVYLKNELRYICEACPKPTYSRAVIEQNEDDKKGRKLMTRYVATIENFRKRQVRSLEPVTVLDHRSTSKSDSFKIDGLKRSKIRPHQNVEILPEADQVDILDTIPEYTNFKKDLKDRF